MKLVSAVGLKRLFQGDQISALRRTLVHCRDNIGPAGMAGVLCAGLVLEVAFNLRSPANDPTYALPRLMSGDGAKQVPAPPPPGAAIGSWTAIALARPLFTPSRLPYVEETVTEIPTLPRLTGTMISSGEKLCIFSGMNGSIIVRQGDYLGIFRVLSVGSDGVHVSGPAGIASLMIHYDPNQVVRSSTTAEVTAENDVGFPGSNAWPSQLETAR